MCGIAGIVHRQGDAPPDEKVLRAMMRFLVHRGPDDEGLLVDGPVGFGFRRLSIIDLDTGCQPVPNEDGRIWVMLNGEIYNYVELRQTLAGRGHRFTTKTDTETIVHAYEEYGLDFVNRLRGMFAIALWDARERIVLLARDRIGKKPLYYCDLNGRLAFASELKSLVQWPDLRRDLDEKALHDYLSCLYVPVPRSILKGANKLPPGHMLVVNLADGTRRLRRYWSLASGSESPRSLDEAGECLRRVFSESVKIRLRSDVPLGVFLSGGIDSCVTAAEMAGQGGSVQSFCVGFTDPQYDESGLAAQTARRLRTEHHTVVLDPAAFTPRDLLDLVYFMDEPFADSSFVPTFWLCKAARRHVTVALSGDGGDELFAGYRQYEAFSKILQMQRLPGPLVAAGAAGLDALSGLLPNSTPAARHLVRQIAKAFHVSRLSTPDAIVAMATYSTENEKNLLYSGLWRERVGSYSTFTERVTQIREMPDIFQGLDLMMYDGLVNLLADDMLTKVDRASMACSLEVRCPFLDHRLVELSAGMPLHLKLHKGTTKRVVRHAFREQLPPWVLHSRKRGFEIPLSLWFARPEWQELVTDILSAESIARIGIFDPSQVISLRDQVLADPKGRSYRESPFRVRHRLWTLLVFHCWWQLFMRPGALVAPPAPGAS